MKVHCNEGGYSNDYAMCWLKHFEEFSRRQQRGVYRFLLLDGYGSHFTLEFIRFCDEHKIIPFGMPPNLTHLLQPLDLVCFQRLSHRYVMAIE